MSRTIIPNTYKYTVQIENGTSQTDTDTLSIETFVGHVSLLVCRYLQ